MGTKDDDNSYRNNYNTVRKNNDQVLDTIFISLMTLLLHLGALPVPIQKLILNLTSSSLFVSLSFTIMWISQNISFVAIFFAVALFVIGPLVVQIMYYRNMSKRFNSKRLIHPV